jgi:hypothetical protein
MSLHLLAEGPILATAEPGSGADALRLIAWKAETIPSLFPGATSRNRPGFPNQFIHITTKREFGRALKRSTYNLSYTAASGVAGDDELYSLITDECIKFVSSIDWSDTRPSHEGLVDVAPEP